jgi:NADH-quinone oxidoreductase subunit N
MLGLLSGVIGRVNSAVAENAYSRSMFYVVTYV